MNTITILKANGLYEDIINIILDYICGDHQICLNNFKTIIFRDIHPYIKDRKLTKEQNGYYEDEYSQISYDENMFLDSNTISNIYVDYLYNIMNRSIDIEYIFKNTLFMKLKFISLYKRLSNFIKIFPRIFEKDHFENWELNHLKRLFQHDITNTNTMVRKRMYQCNTCDSHNIVSNYDKPIDYNCEQTIYNYEDEDYNNEYNIYNFHYSEYKHNYCNFCGMSQNIIYRKSFKDGCRDYESFLQYYNHNDLFPLTPYDLNILLKRLKNPQLFDIPYINDLFPFRKTLDSIQEFNFPFPQEDIQMNKYNCNTEIISSFKYKKFMEMKKNLKNEYNKQLENNRVFTQSWKNTYHIREKNIIVTLINRTKVFAEFQINIVNNNQEEEETKKIRKKVKNSPYKYRLFKNHNNNSLEKEEVTLFDVEQINIKLDCVSTFTVSSCDHINIPRTHNYTFNYYDD